MHIHLKMRAAGATAMAEADDANRRIDPIASRTKVMDTARYSIDNYKSVKYTSATQLHRFMKKEGHTVPCVRYGRNSYEEQMLCAYLGAQQDETEAFDTTRPFSNIWHPVLQWYETYTLHRSLDRASDKLNFKNHASGFSKTQLRIKQTFIDYLIGNNTHEAWTEAYEGAVATYRRTLSERTIVSTFSKGTLGDFRDTIQALHDARAAKNPKHLHSSVTIRLVKKDADMNAEDDQTGCRKAAEVDSLLIPITVLIDGTVTTRDTVVYSVTVKYDSRDGSVYVHRLKEGETTIDPFACAVIASDGSALMTERGTAVSEMLQLWNAAPETFIKRLGQYTGYCTLCGMALTDKRSLEKGYGSTCARTVALMQRHAPGYNMESDPAPAAKRPRVSPPSVPVKLVAQGAMYDLDGRVAEELKSVLRNFDYELPIVEATAKNMRAIEQLSKGEMHPLMLDSDMFADVLSLADQLGCNVVTRAMSVWLCARLCVANDEEITKVVTMMNNAP